MRFGLSLALLLVAAPLFGQGRSFEVASIKPSEATARGAGMSVNGARVHMENFAPGELIME